MKILIIGSGGREHAIGAKIFENKSVTQIYFAPGNGGTADIGENIPIQADEIDKLRAFAASKAIDLTIVGPELPLSMGIVDVFEAAGLKIFGPSQAGARLESSKSFAKRFMEKYQIPTAAYSTFDNFGAALAYLKETAYPAVIKADGLAAGKGVVICQNYEAAQKAVQEIMADKIFGEEGSSIVVEEFLEGKEVSLLCFTDSKTIVPMTSASDYKKAYDNDQGLNTGGMGSISPSPYYEEGSCDYIAERTLEGIQKEGMNIKGVVYIGLILTKNGPRVLEYNMRFGDPETEALLPRLDSDFVEIMEHIIAGRLAQAEIRWSAQEAIAVILAAEGYPIKPQIGTKILLPQAPEDVFVFHAGTRQVEGNLISDGGRVLAISALGVTAEAARAKAYEFIEKIEFPKSFYRRDIGAKDE